MNHPLLSALTLGAALLAAPSAAAQILQSPLSEDCVPAGFGNTSRLTFTYGMYDGFGPSANLIGSPSFGACLRGFGSNRFSDFVGGFWGGEASGTFVGRIGVTTRHPADAVSLQLLKVGSFEGRERAFELRASDFDFVQGGRVRGDVGAEARFVVASVSDVNHLWIEWGGTDASSASNIAIQDLTFLVTEDGATAVPEPETMALVGVGLGALTLVGLRRRA